MRFTTRLALAAGCLLFGAAYPVQARKMMMPGGDSIRSLQDNEGNTFYFYGNGMFQMQGNWPIYSQAAGLTINGNGLPDNGGNLSTGQRQLLSIARAILARPAILILDEATSSVDTRTEILIQEALHELMRGTTCFVIAHRLSTIRQADTIVVLDGGQVVESGTHEQLIANSGFYSELYQLQFSTGMPL